jgi:hypothetical protein
MIPPLHPRLAKIAHLVKSSNVLEKLATQYDDALVREKAAEAKVHLDALIFGSACFSVNSQEKTAAAENPIQHTAEKMAELALSLYGMEKMAAHESVEDNEVLQEAMQKLATVGAIEGLLDTLPGTMSGEAAKLANELRVVNRSYGTQILGEVIKESSPATVLQPVIVRPREKGTLEQAADEQRAQARATDKE